MTSIVFYSRLGGGAGVGGSGGGGGLGSVTVQTPAEALFEHPVPATALFEAADMGTEGLTVTLGEPLEYGLDVNNWAITGHQRAQGTPDTAAQNPSVAGTTFTHTRYVGEFTTANLPDRAGYGNDWHAAYDTTRNEFVLGNALNDWREFSIGGSINDPNRWEVVFGDPPTATPWAEDGSWRSQLQTDGAFEYANEAALNASLGANLATWQGTYRSSQNVLWFDQSDGDVKIFGAVTPAIAEVKASVDLPTSATGGIRVTHITAVGTAGNDWEFRLDPQNSDDDPPIVIQTFPGNNPPYYRSVVRNGATAQELLEYSEAPHRTDVSAAFYGTETGTTVLVTNGAFNYAALGGRHDFSGGVDEQIYVAPVPGIPDDPIHIILDENARDQSRLTQEAVDFIADPALRYYTDAESAYALPGQYADDAAAAAAIPAGVQRAVYYSEARAGMAQGVPFRFTADGGANWGFAVNKFLIYNLYGRAEILSDPVGDVGAGNEVRGTAGAFADAAAAAAYIVTNLADYDFTRPYMYYDQALQTVRMIPRGVSPFFRAPVMEIYYNIAAGGRLTGPDQLGDIRDFINTHLEGLTAEFAGGADANTDVTRPFANRSAFSGGSLSGLRILMEDPLGLGSAGNDWLLKARSRFAGSAAAVSERQAHILLYTRSDRRGGIRVTLDADIQGLNEHGVPVDISSGQLGNEWTFEARDPTLSDQNVVRISTANRQIIYYALTQLIDSAAGTLFNALNQAGTGVTATTFNQYNSNSQLFTGASGRINTLPAHFHDGRDYHPGGNPDPLAITIGPENATTRLYIATDGGIELTLTDPANASGVGWTIEAADGALAIERRATEERFILSLPGAAPTAAAIVTAINDANVGITAAYFGTEDGTGTLARSNVDRHEFLGGLDAQEIEIEYAFEASGNIANPDTMGDAKAVIDAVDGLSSFYYGGATATTTANRATPWEHEFEDGLTESFDLSGFALGPEQNVFTGADRAAAEAARDAYALANPQWVIARRGQAALWISLRWGTGGQIGQTLRANASNPPVAGDWTDQALALQGARGLMGLMGLTGQARTDAEIIALIAQHMRTDAQVNALIDARLRSDAAINALIDARLMTGVKDYARTGGPLVMPTDAADAFMLDAEFTAAAVRALLNLTATEVNDLLTGGTISGRTITFTQNDGSTQTITLPADMDTQDGVVASGSIDAAGTELTLTLDTGVTVVVDIPAILRTGTGAADGVVTGGSINAAGTQLTLTRSVGADVTIDIPAILRGGTPVPADQTIRGAISTDTTLEQAEYNAGTSSDTQEITVPTWTMGERYVFIGVPEAENDITDIDQSGISEFGDWERVPGVMFTHKWWRHTTAQNIFDSGRTYNITQ